MELFASASVFAIGVILGGIAGYGYCGQKQRQTSYPSTESEQKQLLHVAAKNTESSFHHAMKYWELLIDRERRFKHGETPTGEQEMQIKSRRKRVFNAMNELSATEGDMLLLGLDELHHRLRNYADVLTKLYGAFHSDTGYGSMSGLEKLRMALINSRQALFEELVSLSRSERLS